MSSVLHRTLQIQVALLTSIINGTLRQELTKLEATIQILKTTSTPVFIQALASEELMNRTINDFLLVQQESQVDLLADYVSNITQSLSTLNISHSLSTETLQSLTSQVQLLYTQAQQISELVSELQSIASMTLGSIEEIRSLSGDTIILTVSLQQNLTYIQQNVYSLRQQIKYFAMDIMQINIHIQIPTVPSSNEVTMLLGNLSTSQHNIADLEDQLTEKQTDLQLLGDNLVESEIKTDSLLQDISNISYEIANLKNRAQEAKNTTMTTRDDIQWKISEAGEVLVNLQNYNNDTFEVARRANAALQSVAEITTDAINVMNTTSSIQQNVSEVIDILHEAMNVANAAENVTVAAYMVCLLRHNGHLVLVF
jgi:chromosome segregation ATPase